jgi:AraC family transcriptional regulator
MSQTKMNESPVMQLEAPRFESDKSRLIAGLRSRYTTATMNNMPAQWQRFAPHIGKVPGQVGRLAYGVCLDASDSTEGIEYLTGVEVSSASGLPDEFSVVAIPSQRSAVFLHREHVSRLRGRLDAISQKWVPKSGHELARDNGETPTFFERYTEDFDPCTGMGGIEVWIRIKL